MLALVKKPHIELSIQGDHADQFISWIREKFEVTILTESKGPDSVPVEATNFWKEMQSNRVGNLLVTARLKGGFTQKQLAKTVGIRQSMISEYENGKRRLTKKMGEKISVALKIKLTHLK